MREMTLDELRVREEELAEELARMRLQNALQRLDNPLQVREARHDLARVKTVISEKLRAAGGDSAPESAPEVDEG